MTQALYRFAPNSGPHAENAFPGPSAEARAREQAMRELAQQKHVSFALLTGLEN